MSHLRATLILAASCTTIAHAQPLEGGARALALGRAGAANADDVWAEANPATWATLTGRWGEVVAGQAFGLPELRSAGAAVAMPTAAGTVAIALRAYGFTDYRESRASLGVARTVPLAPARRLAVGLRADYHAVVFGGEFGSIGVLDISAGIQADIAPTLRAGLAGRNLAGVARSDSSDLRTPLSTSPALVAGVAYRPAASTLLLVDVDKDLDFPLVVRVGVEMSPVSALALRIGTALSPDAGPSAAARLAIGAGVHAGRLRGDLAVEWHGTLGPSPAFGLGVRF